MFAEEICLQESVNLTSQPNSNSQDECFYQNFFFCRITLQEFWSEYAQVYLRMKEVFFNVWEILE